MKAGHQARLVVISVFNLLDGRCHIRVQPVHLRIHYRTADYPQEAGITGADQYAHGICFFAAVYKCVKLIDLCRGYHDTRDILFDICLDLIKSFAIADGTKHQFDLLILLFILKYQDGIFSFSSSVGCLFSSPSGTSICIPSASIS